MFTEPKFKKEIVINKCPNPDALSLDIGTKRAMQWIAKEALKFGGDGFLQRSCLEQIPPYHITLIVSKCFDINEVKEYLETPVYENIPVIKLLKQEH